MNNAVSTPSDSPSNQCDLSHISPDLRHLSIAVDSLTPDPANARTHSVRNVDVIKGSLTRFGQVKPIVINSKGVVLAGNGTLEAAKQLGWKSIAAVRTTMSSIDDAAFGIADNRSAELAQWDEDALARTLLALHESSEIDEIVTGFTPDEIAKLITQDHELPASAGGKEFDESVANDVKMIICPHCSKEFPA